MDGAPAPVQFLRSSPMILDAENTVGREPSVEKRLTFQI
jgi:hypothetical protein